MAMETTHKRWTDSLLQTSVLLFHLAQFVKYYRILLELNSNRGLYLWVQKKKNKSFARVHFLHKTLESLLATTRTTRAKKSRKRWIHPVSKFIAFIPYRSICQMLVNFLELNSKVLHPSFKRNPCLVVRQKTWNQKVSRRGCATMAKKRTKKLDVRAKLLFC